MIENNFRVIIPVYNSEKWIKQCIWSLYNQNYTNWECVIINDASTDKTLDCIKSFMKDIPDKEQYKKMRFRVLDRTKNVKALENIVYGIDLMCDNDEDIIVLLDGDDCLSSCSVIRYLNELYQDNTWLTYGQFQFLSNGRISNKETIMDTRSYRTHEKWRSSHLRTFKYKLWKKVKDEDLRNKIGKYYQMAWDLAIMYPMIEMAGSKRIKRSDRVLYIYNDLNPLNEHKKNNAKIQKYEDIEIRSKIQYQELLHSDESYC